MSYDQEHSFNNSSEIQRNPNIFDQIKRGYQSTIDYIKERSSETGVRIIGTTAGIALAAAALSGCATGEAPEKTPTETSAPVETPSETPEATPTPDRYEGADFTEKDPLPANLEYLNEATLEEFAQAPKLEQLAWASWAEQYKSEFTTYINAVSPEDANAPYELSPSSDLNTILKDVQATKRISASVGEGTPQTMDDNGQLDTDKAQKILLAHNLVNNIPAIQGEVAEFSEYSNGLALNVVQIASTDLYPMAEDAANDPNLKSEPAALKNSAGDIDVNGFVYTYTTRNGNTANAAVGVVGYTDFRGNQAYTTVSSY